MRVDCSPFVAVLHSKDCSTLLAAIRSMVSQPGAPCPPFHDLEVLTGWHATSAQGAAAARARQSGGAAMASHLHGTSAAWTPLVVVVEDAEHFHPDVLNDLIYACASVRSASGVPLPICFVFALSAGVEALHGVLQRSTLILLRGTTFALASTERSLDAILQRTLSSACLPQLGMRATRPGSRLSRQRPQLPRRRARPARAPHPPTTHPLPLPLLSLSPRRYAALLDSLSEQHGSTTAFVMQLLWVLHRHFQSALPRSRPVGRSRHPAAGVPRCVPRQGVEACRRPRRQLRALCYRRYSPPCSPRRRQRRARRRCATSCRAGWSRWWARRCRAAALACAHELLSAASRARSAAHVRAAATSTC